VTKFLTLDEMLEVALEENLPSAVGFRAVLEAIGSRLASELGEHLKANVSLATFEGIDLGGTIASFKPMFEGQSVPKALVRFDPDADWNNESEEDDQSQELH
jgi:hypothetical protein